MWPKRAYRRPLRVSGAPVAISHNRQKSGLVWSGRVCASGFWFLRSLGLPWGVWQRTQLNIANGLRDRLRRPAGIMYSFASSRPNPHYLAPIGRAVLSNTDITGDVLFLFIPPLRGDRTVCRRHFGVRNPTEASEAQGGSIARAQTHIETRREPSPEPSETRRKATSQLHPSHTRRRRALRCLLPKLARPHGGGGGGTYWYWKASIPNAR